MLNELKPFKNDRNKPIVKKNLLFDEDNPE